MDFPGPRNSGHICAVPGPVNVIHQDEIPIEDAGLGLLIADMKLLAAKLEVVISILDIDMA